jgi:flagellar basal body-associated protein FliL
MEETQTTENNLDEELYKKNRQRFLSLIKIVIGVLLLIALVSGFLWYQSNKSYNYQKSKLDQEHQEIQQKHSQ